MERGEHETNLSDGGQKPGSHHRVFCAVFKKNVKSLVIIEKL